MKNFKTLLENYSLLIWSIFPSVETFHNFKKNKRNISVIEKLIALAEQKKVIKRSSETEFEALIKRCSEIYKNHKPATELSYESLIEIIKKDFSVKSLVGELKQIAEYFDLEEANEVVFTRFKKDFHPNSLKKQHVLMSLAIWLAANKPELGLNYSTMLNFPRRSSDIQQEDTEGLRMELVFTESRGNIDPSTMDFLKDTLPKCVHSLEMSYLNENRVTYLATNCIVKIPVREGAAGIRATYGEALRDALSLAYQLLVAWQLTPFHNSTIQFIIAIDAGPYAKVADTIKDLLHPALSADLPVRLSHFAYMIAKQMDIRVIFRETTHPNIWAVKHFWAFPYFKSPPMLLPSSAENGKETSPLPVRDADIRPFQDALFFGRNEQVPLLDAVRRYPPKVTLALEVAHIATLRRMNHEAAYLLSHVLSFEPLNQVALALRMQNFIALGNYAGDWNSAALLFDRGICDGHFIEKYCPPDPVYYAIYGLLFYSKAIKLLRFIRRGKIREQLESKKQEILKLLEQAEFYTKMGTCVSHTAADNRCAFWLAHYYAFRKLLLNNPALMTDQRLPYEDKQGIYISEVRHVYRSMGMLLPLTSDEAAKAFCAERLMIMLSNYLNSISALSHYVNVLFSATTMLWDFSTPEEKPLVIDQVLMLLDMALDKTSFLKEKCLGVYICTEIQSPGEFIRSLKKVKQLMEKIKQTEDYGNPVKISLMNLDEENNAAPITYDLMQKET
ncbi:MAG: hypothetical protein JW925_12120 [Syntrophaceae bacterium]|nr:hypothetical protein [Syntrophaceae bacterium]